MSTGGILSNQRIFKIFIFVPMHLVSIIITIDNYYFTVYKGKCPKWYYL